MLNSFFLFSYGLNKFTEFLRQEFSHENIYFWSAAERYRLIEGDGDRSATTRRAAARNILRRHLAPGAVDPINLDAATRLTLLSSLELTLEGPSANLLNDDDGIEEVEITIPSQNQSTSTSASATPTLTPPPQNLFLQAQNQIYNLMKYDSYPRFLKSGLYTDCVRKEMTGSSLSTVTLDDDFSVDLSALALSNDQRKISSSSSGNGTYSGSTKDNTLKNSRHTNRLSVFWDTTWGRKDGGSNTYNGMCNSNSSQGDDNFASSDLKHSNHR